uniref:Uncharacterized protein n=1 Tax=Triticum urartu TaxID=4572 RepID=A0A8R7R3V8_TRIUA
MDLQFRHDHRSASDGSPRLFYRRTHPQADLCMDWHSQVSTPALLNHKFTNKCQHALCTGFS